MTAYDNWLAQGSERPERDEDEFAGAVESVENRIITDCLIAGIIEILYNARPALAHVLSGYDFPIHLRPYINALANLSADISAKVDDEYKSLTETYNDPRD